jgi:hypothetical protein
MSVYVDNPFNYQEISVNKQIISFKTEQFIRDSCLIILIIKKWLITGNMYWIKTF